MDKKRKEKKKVIQVRVKRISIIKALIQVRLLLKILVMQNRC